LVDKTTVSKLIIKHEGIYQGNTRVKETNDITAQIAGKHESLVVVLT